MEVETLTVTAEDKQQPGAEDQGKDGRTRRRSRIRRQPETPRPRTPSRLPERKRTRNLSEDKRFKLFSRHRQSAAGRGDRRATSA